MKEDLISNLWRCPKLSRNLYLNTLEDELAPKTRKSNAMRGNKHWHLGSRTPLLCPSVLTCYMPMIARASVLLQSYLGHSSWSNARMWGSVREGMSIVRTMQGGNLHRLIRQTMSESERERKVEWNLRLPTTWYTESWYKLNVGHATTVWNGTNGQVFWGRRCQTTRLTNMSTMASVTLIGFCVRCCAEQPTSEVLSN